MDQVKERGAAQFVAKLSQGVITITHTTEDGPVLAQEIALILTMEGFTL